MKRETLLRWITIGVILAFILELFVVVLYSSNTPTPSAASVTPPPRGASFAGRGIAKATVTALGGRVLIRCAGADAAAESLVRQHSEFSGVLRAGDVIQALINASTPAASFASLSKRLEGELVPACPQPLVGRQAFIDLASPGIALTGSTGENATLYGRDVANYFNAVYRSAPFAFASPATDANASVNVLVQAVLVNGALSPSESRVFIEEASEKRPVPVETLQPSPAPSPSASPRLAANTS